jgi:LuxR family maltose regulon positive regulatory protein
LISDKVCDEIKNHPNFNTTSLGKFNLKNVKHLVELFALTNDGLQIPTKKSLMSRVEQSRATDFEEKQFPLLNTKLYIPQLRPDLVQRPHLIDRMNKGIYNKLTLISAPAGFGKTTLVSEWIYQSEIPITWISLDKGDNDPRQFFHYLIAALQNIDSVIGQAALTMLQSPQLPRIESVMTSLIEEITDIPNDFIIVLDDYHSIDTKSVHSIIEFLLDHLPTQMHLVLTTRVDPPLPLARLRGRNQLTEFRATDLCFSLDEASEFFNKFKNLELSNHDISILESRTEGWIAGLQLTALSMQRHHDIPAFISSFAGDDRHIVDYLAEEVLNLQPESVKNFLLQTSILSQLSESLCNFVINREDSQKILDELEKANLFIIPLDDKRHWYRYHHLFADLLHHRLNQDHQKHLPVLHHRASEWYEKNGFNNEAIEHALLSKDIEQATRLIEEHIDAFWQTGAHSNLRSWLEELPDEIIISKPHLCIFRAWDLFATGQQDASEQVLQKAENELDQCTRVANKTILPERDQQICSFRGRASAIRAWMAAYRADAQGIIQHSSLALKYLPEQDLTWRSAAAITLGDAYFIKGDYYAANQARSDAMEANKSAGNIYLFMNVSVKKALTLKARGLLRKVIEICIQRMDLANEKRMAQTDVVGWLLTTWADVLAEKNNLDEALDLVNRGVRLTESGGDVVMLGWSYICLMRVLFSRGDYTGVESVIQKMENIAKDITVPPWLMNLKTVWQARTWLTQNKLDEASQWLSRCGIDPKIEPTYMGGLEYIALARILLALGRWNETTTVLHRMFESAKSGGDTTRMIEIKIVLALAYQAGDETDKAMTALLQALAIAKPEGFIRIFVDEGPPIAKLLEDILNNEADAPKAYIKKLLSAFRLSKFVKIDDGVVEHLSKRELDVLKLIAAGLSNIKITEELYLSLNTVKTHIRNIYSKLDVHNRTEAAVKARELDLI